MSVSSENLSDLLGPEPDDLSDLLGPEPDKPWAHQELEFDLFKDSRARALFWSMRTGKSKAVIDKFCYQFNEGEIDGAIIIAPNGIHLNWVLNEIPRWMWNACGPYQTFAWETPKRADFAQIDALDKLVKHRGMKWFAINMEALAHPDAIKAINRFIASCGRRYAMGISEVHHFGHAGVKRTRKARGLAKYAKFVTVESGTPILNSPLRAYSIFKILDENGLIPDGPHPQTGQNMRERAAERRAKGMEPLTYEDFVQYFAKIEIDKQQSRSIRRRAFKKIREFRNLDELRDLMAPWASVVLREDVEDMPPLLRMDRPVVMSEKQRDAYLEMVSRHLVETEGKMVSAVDAGARMMKLQQILNGYVMDTENGTIVDIDPLAPIYSALVEQVVGAFPGKSIVWCRYREDIRRVCVALQKYAGQGNPYEFHGGVPLAKREPIRIAFNTGKRPIPLVGQPGAGGEGRDFSAADNIIYFSSTPNAIHYTQSEERGTAMGGSSTSIVRLRTYGTVDDRNWALAEGKIKTADALSGRGLRDMLRATNV